MEDLPPGVGRALLGAAGRMTLGTIAGRVLSFITGIVAARILTDVEFGGFGVVQNTVFVTATIATFALGLAATRFIANARAEDEERAADIARVVLSVGAVSVAVVGIAFLIAVPWVATTLMSEPSLQMPLRVAVVYIFGVVGFGISSGVLLGYERYGASALAAVVQNVVILLAVVWLAPRMRLTGTILAQALGFATSSGFALWFLRDELKGFSVPRFRAAVKSHLPVVARFCVPHVLSTAAMAPATAMASILLARSEPSGYSELGYFTAGQRYYMLILFFSSFLGPVLLPVFSRLAPDASSSRLGLDYGLIGTGMLAVPVGVAIIFSAPILMSVFGHVYTRHWAVLIPVAVWASTEAVGSVIAISLVARGKQWLVFAQQASFAVSLIGLSLALRSRGAPGLAAAYLGSVVVVAVWSFVPMRNFLRPSGRAVAAYLMAFGLTLGAALASFAVPDGWRLPAAVVGGALALSAYLFLLETRERESLIAMARSRIPGVR